MWEYAEIRPCRADIGFEALPAKDYRLDLKEIAQKIRDPFEVVSKLPILLLLRHKDLDLKVSLFPSARILIRDINDSELGREIIRQLAEIVSTTENNQPENGS